MYTENHQRFYFQLAIICMSFAEYAVEAFTNECDPDPMIVQVCEFSSTLDTPIIGEYFY